jgi:hypothetical protein
MIKIFNARSENLEFYINCKKKPQLSLVCTIVKKVRVLSFLFYRRMLHVVKTGREKRPEFKEQWAHHIILYIFRATCVHWGSCLVGSAVDPE